MKYPVYVHVGDQTHSHGVTIPALPGCFSAADEWEDLSKMVQEAVEVYFAGEDAPTLPPPTPLEVRAKNPEYEGGVWLLVDIDLSKIVIK